SSVNRHYNFYVGSWHAKPAGNTRSEITEPAITAALFQGCKPATEWIERKHDDSPDQIDNWQGESPSGWRSDWKLAEMRRLKHPVHLSISRVTYDNREQMY